MDILKEYFKKDGATSSEVRKLLSKYKVSVCNSQKEINDQYFCSSKNENGNRVKTLVFCSSAIRCTFVKRRFSHVRVVKLFAKHIKIKDQINFLKRKIKVSVGLATPSRLVQLISIDRDLFDHLENIIIDTSKDKRELNILDVKETRRDLYQFLGRLNLKANIILTDKLF